MDWTNWVEYELLDNTLLTWGTAIAVFLLAWAALGLVRRAIRRRIDALADKRADVVALQIAASAVRQTKGWFLLLVALLVASRVIVWREAVGELVTALLGAGLLLQAGIWGTAALAAFFSARRRQQLALDPGAVAAMDFLGFVLRAVVWAAILLTVLATFGVDITALVAGLGIGGIAVALAAQNVLGDLFASLSIVLDKPFVVGDFLAVGDFLGSVEKVGLKTTRLRSLSGEQVTLSNSDLLGSRIRNYGRMFERRAAFSLGVTYRTPVDKLKAIPPMLKEIIEAEDKTRFDRAHFLSFGEFALVFEVVYYVLTPDYGSYANIQQRVNFEIIERFAALGVEFALPTQTLLVAGKQAEIAPRD